MTGYTTQVQNELIAHLNNQALAVLDFSSYEAPDVPPVKLVEHSTTTYSAVVLPNGQVASIQHDQNNAIKIWDIDAGQCIKTIDATNHGIRSILALPDGRIVSGGGDKTIKIWDINSGLCVKTLSGHSVNYIYNLALLPNGHIVSASSDGTLKIWDINSGLCVRTFSGHTNSVYSVAVLSTGDIVSGGADGTVRYWDSSNAQCIQIFTGHTGYVSSVAALPNYVLVSGSNDGTIKVWDIYSGLCINTLSGHAAAIWGFATLSSGQVISVGYDGTIKVWDINNGICLKTLDGNTIGNRSAAWSVAVLPSGRHVISGYTGSLTILTLFPRLSYEMIAPVLTAITPASTLNSLCCQGVELGQAGYVHVLRLAQTIPALKVINVSDTGLTVNQATGIQRALQEKQRQKQQRKEQPIREQAERIRQLEAQQQARQAQEQTAREQAERARQLEIQAIAQNIQGLQTYQQEAQIRKAQKQAAKEQAEQARQLEIQERVRNQQDQQQAIETLRQLTENAILNYREGRYEETLLQCEEGLAKDANNLILLKLKALTYYQQGLYANAQAEFSQRDAIEHEGSNKAWAALSRWKKDKTELAFNISLQEINTVISLAPQKAIGYLARGHLFLASNELAKAEMDFFLFSEKLLIPACGIDDYERAALISLHEKGLAKLALKKEAAKPVEPTARVIPFSITINKPAINVSPIEVPQDYLCPITHEIMLSPVIAEDGYTYEEEAIKAHFQINLTSPMSNEPIENARLLPSRTLRSLILKFLDTHPEFREDGQSESVYFSRQREQDVFEAIQTDEIGVVLSCIEQDKRLLTRPLTKGPLIEQALASQNTRLLCAVLDKLTPSMWATLLNFHTLSDWLVKIAALPAPTLQAHIELITLFLNAAQTSLEFNYDPQELIELGLQESCAVLLIMGLTQLGGINTPLDEEKNTALHRAALSGDISLISALIEQGACLSLKNTAGRKPKDLALLHNHIEVAGRLKEAKIQPLLEKLGIFRKFSQQDEKTRQQDETIQQLNEKIQQQEQEIRALREPVSLSPLINVTPGL